MRRTDLSLDEEIAEVEGRLAQHRAQLRLLSADVRSRMTVKNVLPAAVIGALAIGFAASRYVRRPAAPPPMRKGSRPTRLVGAIAAALLPRLLRPLQSVVAHWLAQRMHRSTGAGI